MYYKADVLDAVDKVLDEGEYDVFVVKNLNDEFKKIIIMPYRTRR